MIYFRKHGIQIAQAWFNEPLVERGSDVVFFVQRTEPIETIPFTEKYTLLLDLREGQEALLSSINADSRYLIRRARDKDGIICQKSVPNKETLAEFHAFYKKFAAIKAIKIVTLPYLEAVADAGQLDLSQAVDPSTGQVIVWHAHLLCEGRARGLCSASLRDTTDSKYRNLVGRANRLLHWSDFLRFKEMGLSAYDWGGWYPGEIDQAKLQINQFKREFGGVVVKEWCGAAALTWKGKLALRVRRLLGNA